MISKLTLSLVLLNFCLNTSVRLLAAEDLYADLRAKPSTAAAHQALSLRSTEQINEVLLSVPLNELMLMSDDALVELLQHVDWETVYRRKESRRQFQHRTFEFQAHPQFNRYLNLLVEADLKRAAGLLAAQERIPGQPMTLGHPTLGAGIVGALVAYNKLYTATGALITMVGATLGWWYAADQKDINDQALGEQQRALRTINEAIGLFSFDSVGNMSGRLNDYLLGELVPELNRFYSSAACRRRQMRFHFYALGVKLDSLRDRKRLDLGSDSLPPLFQQGRFTFLSFFLGAENHEKRIRSACSTSVALANSPTEYKVIIVDPLAP